MKGIVITWRDSCEKHGWIEKDDVASDTTIRSMGLLIKETKTNVTISSSYSKQFKQFVSPMTIPKSAIKKMKRFSVTGKTGRRHE